MGRIGTGCYRTPRRRVSTRSSKKDEAQRVHDKAKAATHDSPHVRKVEYDLGDAIVRWLDEMRHKKSLSDDATMLEWWLDKLGAINLNLISRDIVKFWTDRKAKESSPSRANRYVAVIRALLYRAEKDWGWLLRTPRLATYREPKGRVRYLTPEEVSRLIDELPDHQKPLVRFALATGLRQANCLHLRWAQVDLVRKVAIFKPDEMKNGKAHGIPLNEDAMAAIDECKGNHQTYVFTYRGDPIGQANTKHWRAALKRAGIEDYRWHDNRHTWASTLIQRGVPLNAVQALGGWERHEMVQRYAHLAPDQLAAFAAAGNGLTTQGEKA